MHRSEEEWKERKEKAERKRAEYPSSQGYNHHIEQQDRIIEEAEAALQAIETERREHRELWLRSERLPRLKAALLWWNNEAQDLDGYAGVYWRQILEHEEEILSAYRNSGDICATMDQCRVIAAWALKSIPLEIAHQLPDESDRTVERLAEALRRHHGDKAERLIPLARKHRIAALTTPVQVPVQPEESEPVDDGPLAGLPAEIREELRDLEPGLRNAVTVDEAENLVVRMVRERDARLEREGVPEGPRRERVTGFEKNLRDAVLKWRRGRGLR